MKFPVRIVAGAACIAGAAAFTVARPSTISRVLGSAAPSVHSSQRRAASSLNMSAEDFAKSAIDGDDVVVFSKTFCPFCTATKDLLSGMGIEAKVYELNKMDDGAGIQDALQGITGQRTVPNVFIKQQHIGGNDDTQSAAQSGKIKELLGL